MEEWKRVKNVAWQRASFLYNKQHESRTKNNKPGTLSALLPKKSTQISTMPIVNAMVTKLSNSNIHCPVRQMVSAVPTSAGRRVAKNSISANHCCLSSHLFLLTWWIFSFKFQEFCFLLKNITGEATDYETRFIFFQSLLKLLSKINLLPQLCSSKNLKLIYCVGGKIQQNLLDIHRISTRNW